MNESSCKQVQETLLSGEPCNGDAVEEHLRTCPACRQTAEILTGIQEAGSVRSEPSPELDHAVLAAAKQKLMQQKQGDGKSETVLPDLSFDRSPGRSTRAFRGLHWVRFAAAASVFLVLGLFMFMLYSTLDQIDHMLAEPPAAATLTEWTDSTLELQFATLEADLATLDPEVSLSSTQVDSGLENDLLELQLDLMLEQERIESDYLSDSREENG